MKRLATLFLVYCAALAAQSPNSAPLKLIQTISLPGVEGRMDHMSVDVKGQRLFASGLANGTVEVIDLTAGKRIQTISGVKEPEGILYVPELKTLFVADGEGGAVHAFDGQTYKLQHTASPIPHSDNLRYDPVTQRVYVGFGDGADSGIGIIDAQQMALIGVINLEGHPESFQFDKATGKTMFVNVPTAGHIAVIDTGKRRVTAKWPVTEVKSFYPMALDDANQRVYIGSRRPAKLVAFDMKSGRMVSSIDGAIDTDDLFFDVARKRFYMSGGGGSVSVFEQRDPAHCELLAKIPTGPGARISFFAPELNRFYVAVPRLGKQDARVLVFAVQP